MPTRRLRRWVALGAFTGFALLAAITLRFHEEVRTKRRSEAPTAPPGAGRDHRAILLAGRIQDLLRRWTATGEEDHVEAAVRLLSEERALAPAVSEHLRRAAASPEENKGFAVLLGRLRDPSCLPALEALARDTDVAKEGRLAALRAAAAIGGPRAVEFLIGLLCSDSDLPGDRLDECILACAEPRDIPLLVDVSRQADSEELSRRVAGIVDAVRRKAKARELAARVSSLDPTAPSSLEEARSLIHGDPPLPVRLAALDVVKRRNDLSAVLVLHDTILRAAPTAEDSALVWSAAEGLARAASSPAEDVSGAARAAVCSVLVSDGADAVKVTFLKALQDHGASGVRDELEALLPDLHGEVREAAARIVKDPAALPSGASHPDS